MTLSRTHTIILALCILLALLMPAVHADAPAVTGRSLIVISAYHIGVDSPLLDRLVVLERLEGDAGDAWLVLATEDDRGLLAARDIAFQTLARIDSTQRLYWTFADARDDGPAAMPALLTQGERRLMQMPPTQADAWRSEGYRLIEASRSLPARAPAADLPEATAVDPAIQGIMQQIDAPMLASYVAELSGEDEVLIDGDPVTLSTRYSGTTGMFDAADYLYQYYTDMGMPVERLPFRTDDWVNVVATQTGRVHPEQVYVICAHYDSTSGTPYEYVPGADDNASGSAAVMAAADILSGYTFDYTIRYVHFSGEEQGLLGSKAYAHQSANLGEEIMGVINLDMIAWDGLNGPAFDLHAGQLASSSHQLAEVFEDVVDVYGLDLDIDMRLGSLATTRSDHASFWQEGYAAFLVMEDWDDLTPHYHTTSDTLETLNLDYFVAATQATLGTLSTVAGLLTDPAPPPTPTVTPTPTATPAGDNHLADGDFETGESGYAWQEASAGGYALVSQENPHDGTWGGWLNQQSNATDSLCQTLTLPAKAEQITLDFWWQMQTDEVLYGYDWLEVQVQPVGAGSPIVLARLDSGDLQHVWMPARFSLQAHAGESLELCFVSHSDYWRSTHFFVDDVQVNYVLSASPTPTATATSTATATPTATATQPASNLWLSLIRK